MFSKGNRRVLTALIGVMDNVLRSSSVQRHVQRVENKLCAQVIGHCPTNDASAVNVEHDRKEKKTTPGWDVRDIGNPQLVWCACREVAIDQIRRRSSVAIPNSRFEAFSPCGAVNFAFAHQPCNALVAHAQSFIA